MYKKATDLDERMNVEEADPCLGTPRMLQKCRLEVRGHEDLGVRFFS